MRELLTRDMGGIPFWAWALLVGAGGIGLYLFIRHQQQPSGQSLGQSASSQPADPNIDPNTGIPYNIESQINPATGLPAYYGGPGVSGPPPSSTPPPNTTPPGPVAFPGGDPNGPPVTIPGPTVTPPPTPTPTPTPSPAPTASPTYTVQPGDTLWKIGQRYGVGAATLGNLNNALLISTAQAHGVANPTGASRYGSYPRAWDYIYPGEVLRVPGSPTGSGPDAGVYSGFRPNQATPYWPMMTDMLGAR